MRVLFSLMTSLGDVASEAGLAPEFGSSNSFNGKKPGRLEPTKTGQATYRVEAMAISEKPSEGSPNSFSLQLTNFKAATLKLNFDVKVDSSKLNSGVQIRSQRRKAIHATGRVNAVPQVEIFPRQDGGLRLRGGSAGG